LEQEIAQYGLLIKKQTLGGVYCSGSLPSIYRFILYSRLANRVILVLESLAIPKEASKSSLFRQLTEIPYAACFSSTQTFSVEFRGNNRFIQHSHYGALWVKDAISDHFQEDLGERPSVDRESPDIRIFAQIKKSGLLVGIDLAKGSLHKRGYRLEGAKAPLKENMAAALAIRAGINAGESRPLIDPFCGSGTLLIEAVSMQLGLMAQLADEAFGIHQLKMSRASELSAIKADALQQHNNRLGHAQLLAFGMDEDQSVIAQASANIERAGLSAFIQVKQQAIKDFQVPNLPNGEAAPLLLTNPPYGERIGDKQRLFTTYQTFGQICRDLCQGFDVAVLSSDESLSKALGLQKSKAYQFYNGAIKVSWTLYHIHKKTPEQIEKANQQAEKFQQGVEMVSNRLVKNQKRLKKWLAREKIEAYRLYDADMPEYAFALDVYGDFFQVTEYQA
ncbi:MAG: THUMP domain-containing protein, partial [Cellvibrionales bacterium]|nr:THUMP domain-containing protein [Cellvibrionales bacterium]